MHTDYIVTQFFTPEQLKKVYYYAGQLEFEDGVNAFKIEDPKLKEEAYSLKRNHEAAIRADIFVDFLENKRFSEILRNAIYPKHIVDCVISVYRKGDYYKAHNGPTHGDHLTSIMLTPEEDYTGGDYCLLVDGEVKRFKLKPGEAITHYAGLPSHIDTVTSGVKMTLEFITYSQVTRKEHRDKLINLKLTTDKWKDITITSVNTLEEFRDNELLTTLREIQNIEREYVNFNTTPETAETT